MTNQPLLDREFEPLLVMTEQIRQMLNDPSASKSQAAPVEVQLASDVTTQEIHLPGPEGAPPVRALLHAPQGTDQARAAVLHIHGGGYVMGMPEMNSASCREIAGKLGAVVLSVDYRLAPATQYPGAVEDCYAALAWLHGQAQALNIDRRRIIVSGESAGGGLAAALALLARDRKEYTIAFQQLLYPMLDDRTAINPAPSPHTGQYIWTREANAYGWGALLGSAPGSPDVSCYAAAARASDLAGLPPTYIACGAIDLFIEENLEFARRLILAGVPTEVHVYPGAPHGFNLISNARTSQQAAQDWLAALTKVTSAAP